MDYQDVLDLMRNTWPVLITEVRCILQEIRDNLQARRLDISNKPLSRAMKTFTRSAPYLHAQLAGAVRYDIHACRQVR
ncbi:ProQ/FINO family protein [Klebsiella aerogenes]|uniref:ProQ/FinO domain-containing protein n=1 Tax=Klebsiella aerogenes TaxID=548 RepID=A0AAP9R1R5_KLEAE|nr:ProQ/FINO family protein [Klebsiella aerogenes]QMR42977.1 hypothetical protein HV331_26160 [Klebsiella aerogenes]